MRLQPPDDLEKPHDLRGAEEMQSHHVGGTVRHASQHVDVEVGSVRSEHGTGFEQRRELAEERLLYRHVLERRLDHQVGIGKRRKINGGSNEAHAACHFLTAHASGLDRPAIDRADAIHPGIERRLVTFDQGHCMAGVEKTDRDARAHQPGSHHSNAAHGPRLCVLNTGDARRVPLRKEQIPQRCRFLALPQSLEHRALLDEALLER